ncbi:hypothetical protein FRAAL3909 [Frankia alni ACN14a]|uniref:Uncharacterized protein n=1 Tax=Frankia alni (strain DSM 45986 / CECT 9034 / ACN14a) TaxID=326424 RepID=Q0RIW3_FRAAA|nr:hypothetical protein FRAAL3909 [Frankia alni ACN14a]
MCNPGVVPLVLVHARPLLVGTPQGATGYLEADLRDPAAVLVGAARTLDFDRPVALMLMGSSERSDSSSAIPEPAGQPPRG